MNAPARWPRGIDRYRDVLEGLMPCCPEVEQRSRCGILYLRDKASEGVRRDAISWEAARVLEVLTSIACAHATAPMSLERLDALHRSLFGLMSIANILEAALAPAEQIDG